MELRLQQSHEFLTVLLRLHYIESGHSFALNTKYCPTTALKSDVTEGQNLSVQC